MSDINPITKVRECKFYEPFANDNKDYTGNGICKKSSNIISNDVCYCCKNISITLGYGYNEQGA